MREKLIGEMRSRLAFLLVLVEKNMEDPIKLFASFGEAVMRSKNNDDWKNVDAGLSEFERVLLEYACGTGDMRNHQALFAHKDKNKSHPLESMMVFGKVPEEGNSNMSCRSVVKNMTNAMLIQPYERIVWDLRCGLDVLHSRFTNTYHVSDPSRGLSNWSYVHGP